MVCTRERVRGLVPSAHPSTVLGQICDHSPFNAVLRDNSSMQGVMAACLGRALLRCVVSRQQ